MRTRNKLSNCAAQNIRKGQLKSYKRREGEPNHILQNSQNKYNLIKKLLIESGAKHGPSDVYIFHVICGPISLF